jgi:hypothetical protein
MDKIIFWDVETSWVKAYTWNLWPQNGIPHNNIIEDWTILCGAWKELGNDKVHAVAVKKVGDDKEVVKKLRDVLSDASLIVGHNADKFDVKKLNARLIFHGLEPLAKIPTLDTLKEVKKIAAFTSNRLDFLGKVLTGKGKIHNSPSLWVDVMNGSKKALKEMVEYNKVDVEVLEAVYERLKPYVKNHPHVGVMKGEDKNCTCRNCGSKNVKKNGIRYSAAGVKRQEIKCKDCHAYSLVKYEEGV